ncbi:LysR family transcriptional regulator [Colwellia sp. TT2012]|uniref:LysR family transcriptional regulator n=1 Tax=Colwellia sp. TT2012 TaxID=1720342 RepID=UPI001E656A15|nr:LysR family transcriptional regulator [Colwellia sp. TT2012]
MRKAAEVLFSSQSALSHQIKDLEQRLNTPLFIRNTSPVEFTKAGKLLLNLGEEILPKIKQVNAVLKAPSLFHCMRLGETCIHKKLLPEAIKEFANLYPLPFKVLDFSGN